VAAVMPEGETSRAVKRQYVMWGSGLAVAVRLELSADEVVRISLAGSARMTNSLVTCCRLPACVVVDRVPPAKVAFVGSTTAAIWACGALARAGQLK
jgi:hypothetical protein